MTTPSKLNIGSGSIFVVGEGWLNIDHDNHYHRAVQAGAKFRILDVTQAGSLQTIGPPGSMEFITSSEFFEHLDIVTGEAFLRVCHIMLRRGGRVRIGTPDLEILLAFLQAGKMDELAPYQPDIFSEYKSQAAKFAMYVFGALSGRPEYTGHRHIYDEESLRECLTRCGFVDVKRVEWDGALGDAPQGKGVSIYMEGSKS